MLPEKKENVFHVACLSLLVTSFLTLCLFLIVLLFNDAIAEILNRPEISFWLYLVPISVIISGFYQTLSYWHIKNKRYKVMATNRVMQSSATNFSQLALGCIGSSSGLIWGGGVGQATSLFFLLRKSLLLNYFCFPFSALKVIAIAKRYKKFPILDVPTTLINLAANQAPNILLASFFSSSTAGFYYLTQRVLQAPITLISTSVLDVFKQKASEDYKRDGHCRKIFKKTFLVLFFMALPPSIALYIWVEDLFTFVFGDSWREAGKYAQLLIPALFFRFVVNPLSFVIYIAEKQHINLVGMFFLFLSIIFSLVTADTAYFAISMISASFCMTYFFYFITSAKMAKFL
ncbi:colanic acid exporter [Halomonas sp. THAF5a]|nr:colanic acid exporter [Halomonas sp. THAF5a]